MSKHIQAYFTSEDQAEGARSSLITYQLEQLEVGSLEKAIGRSSNLLIPFAPLENVSTFAATGMNPSSGFASTTASQGVVPLVTDLDNNNKSHNEDREEDEAVTQMVEPDDNEGDLKYVLSAKVEDHNYDEVVHKLRSLGAYVGQT